MLENFLIDNPILQSLNEKERAFLDTDGLKIRLETLWYLNKIEHYSKQISHMNKDISLKVYFETLDEPITLAKAKFQYTFWFEAMVWYIHTVINKIESEKRAAEQKALEAKKQK